MHLHLSHSPRIELDDGTTHELAAGDAALLAWLAIEGPTPRARLVALLWPEKDADAGRNSLRQRLFKLRSNLGAEVVAGTELLGLIPGLGHDLGEADDVLARIDPARQPLGEYARWLEAERGRRRGRVRRSLVELSEAAQAARDWDDALIHAGELLALEPLSEEAHRRVMQLHYLAGDRAAALVAFDRCEQVLKDEVGTRPSSETLALLATIEQGCAPPATRPGAAPAALLRPPRLVGRKTQWAQLTDAVASGRISLLEGEAGMGKSRLVGDFAAQFSSGVVLTGARPGDAGVPFASLLRLIRHALPLAGELPVGPRGALARLLPELGEPAARSGAPEAEAARLQTALEVLFAAAKRNGLRLVVFDDLHFADTTSAEALLAAAAMEASPVWVFAARPDEVDPNARNHFAELVLAGRAASMALPPLSVAHIAELVDSLGIEGWRGASMAPRLHRHTGGSPLFLLETLKQIPAGALVAEGDLPRSATVLQLIGARVARLSPAALKLARFAAVAGQDFSSELATELLGARTLDLADAWAELDGGQVLQGQAFAHDLIREAVLASVPEPLGRRLRAQVAEYLGARRGAPERIAEHWLDSDQPQRAVQPLLEAGRRAIEGLRKAEAAAALERAARLLDEAGDRRGAFEAIDLYFENGMPVWDESSRALADQMDLYATTPAERAKALAHRAHMLGRTGDLAACGSIAEAALRLLPPGEAPLLEGQLMCLCAQGKLHAGDAPGAVQETYRAVASLESSGDEETLASAVASLAAILEWDGKNVEAYPLHLRALEIRKRGVGGPQLLIASALNCANNRVEFGWHSEGLPLLELAERTAAACDLDLAAELPHALMTRARVALDLGDYTFALRRIDDLLPVIERRMPTWLIGLESMLTTLWMRLGQWARAQEVSSRAQSRMEGATPFYAARTLQIAAEVRLGLGLADGQLAALDEAERVLGSGGGRLGRQLTLSRTRWLEPAAALALARQMRLSAMTEGGPGFALTADVRAAQAARRAGDAAAELAHARAALAQFDTVEPLGLYRAEVWLVAAQALVHSHPDEASQVLRGAERWVRDTAEQRLPSEFRDSFLHRNSINRELLALAARTRLG